MVEVAASAILRYAKMSDKTLSIDMIVQLGVHVQNAIRRKEPNKNSKHRFNYC